MITGYAMIAVAREAMEKGAYGFYRQALSAR